MHFGTLTLVLGTRCLKTKMELSKMLYVSFSQGKKVDLNPLPESSILIQQASSDVFLVDAVVLGCVSWDFVFSELIRKFRSLERTLKTTKHRAKFLKFFIFIQHFLFVQTKCLISFIFCINTFFPGFMFKVLLLLPTHIEVLQK